MSHARCRYKVVLEGVVGAIDQGKTFYGASEAPSRAAARGRFGHVS